MSTIAEAKQQLEKLPELRSLVFGLVIGILLAVVAQLILRPLEVKNEQSILIFSYGGAEIFRSERNFYFVASVIAFVGLIVLARWGYRRYRGLHIPVKEKFSHQKPVDDLATKIFEKLTLLGTLYGFEKPSSKRVGKGFHISLTFSLPFLFPFMPFTTSKELLTIDVEEQLVTLSCEKDPEQLVELAEKLREALIALIVSTAPG
mgnify:CR=1 FL=1